MSGELLSGIDAGTLAVIQGRWKAVCYLFEIGLATPSRWCWPGRERQNIAGEIDAGPVYLPRGMSVSGIAWGQAHRVGCRVELDNRDGGLTSLVYGAEDPTDVDCTLTLLVAAEPGAAWEAPFAPFSGPVEELDGEDGVTVSFRLSAMAGSRRRGGLRELTANCGHVYKGQLCQYAGVELTCDRTFATCDARGNAVHFGGCRFAPGPETLIQLGPANAQLVPGTGGSYPYYPPAPLPDGDSGGLLLDVARLDRPDPRESS